jgi:hypothetical protein
MDPLLANLLSAAFGAVIGAMAAFAIQERESRRLAKGATRAVYLELTANGTTARIAASGNGPLGGLRRDAWTSEMARLGMHLDPSDLLAVAWGYQMFADAETALEVVKTGQAKPGSIFHAVLEEFAIAAFDATAALHPKVWSDGERQQMTRAGQRAESRRKVARQPAAKTDDTTRTYSE